MLENDWVEAIVALPTDLFYNTGIQTYVWLVTNRKPNGRRGKVQLIDASSERFWKSMRKSLGSKRREIPEDARKDIVRLYAEMLNGNGEEGDFSKIFDTIDFGYREIRIERPLRLNFQTSAERLARLAEEKAIDKLNTAERDDLLDALGSHMPSEVFLNRGEFEKALGKALRGAGIRIGTLMKKAILSALSERDETAAVCEDAKGNPEPDTELRDHELVPLKEDWRDYVAREVTPFVSDAWVDESYRDESDREVGRVGYEINFNRYFYKYVPPRPLKVIDDELKALEAEITGLLKELAA
jgi:type I restriction enzyme M protein